MVTGYYHQLMSFNSVKKAYTVSEYQLNSLKIKMVKNYYI